MKIKIAIILGALLVCTAAYAQTDNTFYARAFPGRTVGEKIGNAQGACGPNVLIPCIIVLDPSLAGFGEGVLPAKCAQCSWMDYRKGLDVVGASGLGVTVLTYGADPKGVKDSSTAIQAASDAAGDYGMVVFPAGTYLVQHKVRLTHSYQQWLGAGGTIMCNTLTGPCVQVGPDIPNPNQVANLISNIVFRPKGVSTGAGAGTMADDGDAILDNAFALTLDHVSGLLNSGGSWQHFVDITIDENFIMRGFWGAQGLLQCDATYCGSVVRSRVGTEPGASTVNAGVGWITDSTISTQCAGNGIDWMSGNDLHLKSDVIETYAQFGLRAAMGGSYDSGRVLMSKVHLEGGTCLNPQLNNRNATAGAIMNGGTLQNDQGQALANYPIFPTTGTTGATSYWYWVIIHSDAGDSAPMPVGRTTNGPASFTAASSVVVDWPAITAGTLHPTCALLRGPAGGVLTAPYPSDGVPSVVASSIPCTTATGTYATYTDTVAAASLTNYSYSSHPTYNPQILFWPGSYILSGAAVSGNTYSRASFVGTCPVGSNFVTVQGYDDTVDFPQVNCTNTGEYIFVSYPNGPVSMTAGGKIFQDNQEGGVARQVALTYNSIIPFRTPNNIKGMVNLGACGGGDCLTVHDSVPFKTRARIDKRPIADAGDYAIGGDFFGMGLRSGAATSVYNNHLFDGYSWVSRIDGAAMTLKVPLAVHQNISQPQLATPVNGTLTTAATGGTLADNTSYCYKVQAFNAIGHSAGSTETCKTTGTGGGNLNTVTVPWATIAGATSYKVYCRATGAEQLCFTTADAGTLTWTDTGSVTPSGALTNTNTTGGTVTTAGIIPTLLYSAAGTALPACAVGIKGERAVVSDATAPTYNATYTSGGAIVAAVICDGSTWKTY